MKPMKMSMKSYEKTAYDKKMDKEGKHGKEGSKKDLKMDKAAMKKMAAKKLSKAY